MVLEQILVRQSTGTCNWFYSNDTAEQDDVEEDEAGQTIVHSFRRWSRDQPTKTLHTWLDDHGRAQEAWSYRDLEECADAVARALLSKWGCKPKDRAVLVYMPGLHFIAGFWGCLFARVVAVPVYPVDLRKFKVGVERSGRIGDAYEPRVALNHREYAGPKRMMAFKNVFEDASELDGLGH